MLRPQAIRARAVMLGLGALVLMVAFSSTACQRETSASAQPAPPQRVDMRTVTIPVNGMICMVCAGSVKNALKAIDGVEKADVSLEAHNVTVQYERGKVHVDELARAINQLGYKAGVPTPAPSQ